jgi:hypothetical protein
MTQYNLQMITNLPEKLAILLASNPEDGGKLEFPPKLWKTRIKLHSAISSKTTILNGREMYFQNIASGYS